MSAIAAAITAAEITALATEAMLAAEAAAAATAAASTTAAATTAAAIPTASGLGGMMPSAAALGQGAATGEALGVSGGATGSGLGSLSASGLETGNALSRGLTQVGEVLNNPYVQGGIGVAQGGKTYAETGDLGQSFMAGLGAWGMAGAAGGLSSFAGRELGGAALSQGAKQGVKSAIPQIAPKTLYDSSGRVIGTPLYDSSVLGGKDVLNVKQAAPYASNAEQVMQPYAPNVGQTIGPQTPSMSNIYGDLGKPTLPPGAAPLPPRVAPTPGLPTGTTQVAPTPTEKPGWFDDFPKNYPGGTMGALATGAVGGPMLMNAMQPSNNLHPPETKVTPYKGPYLPTVRNAQFPTGPTPWTDTSERQYFDDVNPYPGVTEYPGTVKAAVGGLMGLTAGGSYDDEAGHDGYADGGEVEKKMATPDMNAIQEYIRGINPQIEASASNPLQSYLDNIGRQQQRPQVPEILRQLQAQHATPVDSSEHDYGFKPITVEKAPLGDKYAPYRPATFTAPGIDAHEYQYTDTSKYVYNPETQQMEIPLAVGGLTSLAKGGNYLDGPGDGLSDSIRATIGNRQPARLADGEFVISADVVSDIGGGSSKAGAKYLHAMQDRVRQRAHGTKKQVKKLDLRKVLPA